MVALMFTLLKLAFGWLLGGPLDRILTTIDKKMDNETEREKIKTEAISQYVKAHVAIANSRQWFFPLFFLIPAGFWFGSVCVYSVLWCARCAYPQDWTIAALPPPLDGWMGAIVASLFIGKAGETLISRLRK
jgi:hypothetical protein